MIIIKRLNAAVKKIEYELPLFLILSVKLPLGQIKIYGLAYYLLAAVVAVLLGGVLRKAEKGTKTAYMIFIALLLAGDLTKFVLMPEAPGSLVLYGKAFSVLCFLLCLVLLRKPIPCLQKPGFVLLVPLLCTAGIVAGQSFVFFFIPVVLIILTFEKYRAKAPGIQFTFTATAAVAVILPLALLVWGGNSESLTIDFLGFKPAFRVMARTGVLKAFATVLPLLAVFPAFWLKARKASENSAFKRILLLCTAAPVLSFVLCTFFFYPFSDGWKFYVSAVLLTQFCMLFYLLDAGEKTVMDTFGKMTSFLQNNPVFLLGILIYLVKIPQLIYPV